MSAPDLGRARTSKARRRQRKIAESLDVSWKKYARCSLCNYRYCVNNYKDRKVRVNQDKIGGKIVCPWCRHRYGKFGVQLMMLAEKVAAMKDIACQRTDLSVECKCMYHVAERILKAHAEAPTRR